METIDFVPLLVLGLINKKVIDWLRVLIPDTIEAKVLIPLSWLLGIGLALLFSTSEALGGAIVIFGEHTLANGDIGLVIVYGLALACTGGVVHDFVKPSTPPHDQPEVMAMKREHAIAEGEPLDQVTIVAEDPPPAV